ncbi:MAG: CpaF family protein [Candidatus Hydrogenedentota bacterium]|nr:MAG: CpaF family protein [Candidatus Hydrogenedentota bacterium]
MSLAEKMAQLRTGGEVEKKKKVDLHNKVTEAVRPQLDVDLLRSPDHEMRDRVLKEKVTEAALRITTEENINLSKTEFERLVSDVVAGILGFGPLERLLRDKTVTEIMTKGPYCVFVEQNGKVIKSDVKFRDEEELREIVDKIMKPLGRVCDETTPYQDARLPDGSRVNVVIPPLALDGTALTIRKFSKNRLTHKDLIRFGSMTEEMAEFLKCCVKARLNIIVSGGTGSGKTTLLNVLSSFIPEEERTVTIEDAAELSFAQEHVIRLETRPPDFEGKGEITIRDMVRNALRMRPDRIVVGECRGGEAMDMLQAMNTGHDGSMTTIHANSPQDVISRLETLVMMAGYELPIKAIRKQISSAINLIIQQSRLLDGSRKITYITEVQGMEGESILLQDIFVFEQEGMGPDGKIIGKLKPTGLVPKFIDRFKAEGIEVSPALFHAQNEE